MEQHAIFTAMEACDGNLLKAVAAPEFQVSTIHRKKPEWTPAIEAAEQD